MFNEVIEDEKKFNIYKINIRTLQAYTRIFVYGLLLFPFLYESWIPYRYRGICVGWVPYYRYTKILRLHRFLYVIIYWFSKLPPLDHSFDRRREVFYQNTSFLSLFKDVLSFNSIVATLLLNHILFNLSSITTKY